MCKCKQPHVNDPEISKSISQQHEYLVLLNQHNVDAAVACIRNNSERNHGPVMLPAEISINNRNILALLHTAAKIADTTEVADMVKACTFDLLYHFNIITTIDKENNNG